MKNKLGKYLYWGLAVLPFILSAVFYSRLPDQVATHWNAAGNIDGYSSRLNAALELPSLMLIFILFIKLIFSVDPKRQNINNSPQIKSVLMWGLVILSNIGQCVIIFNAINYKLNVSVLMTIFLGVFLAAIGNYLPKCKPNYTMGIKLPWTLASEENWRKTHHFAGPVWIIGGLLVAATAFTPYKWLIIGISIALVIIPGIYSYFIYQREKSGGFGNEK